MAETNDVGLPFCPNCRFVIDDGMETVEEAKDEGTSCCHRVIEDNRYFGSDDGEPFSFVIYKADTNIPPYLDDMMENISALESDMDAWYGPNRSPLKDSIKDSTIWDEEQFDRAMDRMLGINPPGYDKDEEDEYVGRGRNRNRNKNKSRRLNIKGALKSAVDTVKGGNHNKSRSKQLTPEEREAILAQERAGVIAS